MTTANPAPTRFCDVVMKGGITSGVVYPLAVKRLAERFKLKNLGGTSAGAIAAAAAAAAELGRASGGFDRLGELPEFLSDQSPDGKGSNLFAFFQPQPATRPLFKIAMSALGGGKTAVLRVIGTTMWAFPLATLIGSLLGLLLLVGAMLTATGLFFFICLLSAIVLSALGILVSLALAVTMRAASALPNNYYGLCTGMTDAFHDVDGGLPTSQGKPLTFWLMEYLDETAGRKTGEPPLTFADLWGTRDPNAERAINLEMMTTCVTHGRPYRVPFRDDEDLFENNFYFCRLDFDRLFPKRIVEWLIAHPREIDGDSAERKTEAESHRAELAKREIYPMPAPADLPVVVAVRMSVSFPILLSAIPLYAIERRRDPKGKNPERCWFTDGGVCSNFPLHFFDASLPRRPTLSINLSEKPDGTPAIELAPEMVENNEAGRQERWNRFEVKEVIESGNLVTREKSGFGKICSFVGSLIKTMQNWTDNTQSRLPGFRDRIVHVPLTSNEGGLNLNMPDNLIGALTTRGQAAGEKLLEHFDDPPKHEVMTWDNHRWVRMRSMMASLEKMLFQIDTACAHPEGSDTGFDQWIASESAPPSYPLKPKEQRRMVLRTLRILRRVARAWRNARTVNNGAVSAASGAPRPRPELRPRAQI
jgi:hypothetical protein